MELIKTKLQSCLALAKAIGITIIYCLRLFWLNKTAKRKLIMTWCHKLMKIFKCTYTIEWRVKDFDILNTKEPLVVMSNHASHLDIPFLFLTFDPRALTMIAKKELFKIPLFGKAMYHSELAISVDREDHKAAMNTMQKAADLINGGKIVWIAPEGHRSTDGKLGRFKRGGFWLAKHSKANIVPVTIIGSGKVLPANRWLPKLNKKVKIIVGPLIDTTKATERELMDEVRLVMEQNLVDLTK